MSTSPERVRAYLEMPSDQLTAGTPGQFSQVLGRIMTTKGLTASQVAIKARIPRSQAYNMVSATRGKLPSRPAQVLAFVEACDLAPVQVALVMDLWAKLDKQARDQAAQAARPAAGTDVPGGDATFRDPAVYFSGPPRRRRRFSQRSGFEVTHRPTALMDLLFLILEDSSRTRHALRLLVPLLLTFVAIIAILTTWAILQPEHAMFIAGVLASTMALPSMALKSLMGTRR